MSQELYMSCFVLSLSAAGIYFLDLSATQRLRPACRSVSAMTSLPRAIAEKEVSDRKEAILQDCIAMTTQLREYATHSRPFVPLLILCSFLVQHGIQYEALEEARFPIRRLQKQNRRYRKDIRESVMRQARKAKERQNDSRVRNEAKEIEAIRATISEAHTKVSRGSIGIGGSFAHSAILDSKASRINTEGEGWTRNE